MKRLLSIVTLCLMCLTSKAQISVNPDGSFVTIEGNSSDKVQRVTRRPNDVILRGFIRV